jgi:hypothetical protein
MGQNPVSHYILYDESKHNNILPLVGKANNEWLLLVLMILISLICMYIITN